jgi:nucleoside-diphosphate-sugar epimerase
MIKIIGESGFIGTRLSKRLTQSKKEFGIVIMSPFGKEDLNLVCL